MLALAEIDLGTLTPEQREAATQAIAALETLGAENEALADRNEAQAERIRLSNIWCASCSGSYTARGRRS